MGVDRTARTPLRAGALVIAVCWAHCPANAQDAAHPIVRSALNTMLTHHAAGLVVLVGLIVFSTILSLLYLHERGRWMRRERSLVAELSSLQGAHDRADLLLNAERQAVISWAGRDEPVIEGDTSFAQDGAIAGIGIRRILAFGSWLAPQDAARIEADVDALRQRGTPFRLTLHSLSGHFIEAQGQAVGGRAILRLRETTGEHRELIEMRGRLEAARSARSGFESLLDAIPHPIWHRAGDGGLGFVNRAYLDAVESGSREAALAAGTELLDRSAREAVASQLGSSDAAIPLRVNAVVTGTRRSLEICERPVADGRVGIAVDVSEIESERSALQRQMKANARTLDQLPTAIAMFDAQQRLIYFNAAYQTLWDLDAAYLESGPSDGEILDRLRAERKLPEQQVFRTWKSEILSAYRAVKATEWSWYLPDGRSLSVVADPNPQGGLTYLYQDLSEKLQLHSRFSALMKERAETLNALKEPVAVFGADYRITLANRAFEQTWGLHEETLKRHPRIDEIIAACRLLSPDPKPWDDIRNIVTGLSETRASLSCRLEMINDTVLDCTAQALPAGATLLTFIDVTASVKAERLLIEKNDALERAAQLRDTFVNHVSYELRSPLTNIIGFAELLSAQTAGALNERQREYSDHIKRSSSALLAIINDILDLASIDARALELQRETVDVRETIEAAVVGIEDRLVESKVGLDLDVPADTGSFSADAKRIRQVLFNLLSNAVAFSRPGQRVQVEARRKDDVLVLKVIDQGRGIPPEVILRVFDRFESHTLGTKHRGVGLGLSIVRSFVELHGGQVVIESDVGTGTRVICTFPLEAPNGSLEAAE